MHIVCSCFNYEHLIIIIIASHNSSYFDELEAQNLGRTRTPLKEKFRRYGSFALHKWNATHFVHTPSSLVQCLLDLESTFICQTFEFTKHLYMHSSDGLICTSEIAFASYFVAQVFYIFLWKFDEFAFFAKPKQLREMWNFILIFSLWFFQRERSSYYTNSEIIIEVS